MGGSGLLPQGHRAAEAGWAWVAATRLPSVVAGSSAAGLAGPADWADWAGGAGRNRTASSAPAAATAPATRQLTVRPRRKALADACCSAWPKAGWPRAAILPAAT